MLPLETLQRDIASAILHGNPARIASLISAGRADAIGRMRIYRNNTIASLTATLMAVFPVTVRLVDERSFRRAAAAFIRQFPPVEPRLVRYGAEFPRFLRTFDGLESSPFVAETARLEWAIAEALDVPVLPSCPVTSIAAAMSMATPELRLQPSLRLLFCHRPALSIWIAHQDRPDVDSAVTAASGTERIAVWRRDDRVGFQLLGAAEFAFRHAIAHGQGLARAVERAFAQDTGFDVGTGLVRLFADGLVTTITQGNHVPITDGGYHDDR